MSFFIAMKAMDSSLALLTSAKFCDCAVGGCAWMYILLVGCCCCCASVSGAGCNGGGCVADCGTGEVGVTVDTFMIVADVVSMWSVRV